MSRRRRIARPEGLTSLLDVLFILVFASLVQLSAVGASKQAVVPGAAAPEVGVADAGVVDAGVVDAGLGGSAPAGREVLRRRALDDLAAAFEGRSAVIARVTSDGVLRALERGDQTIDLGVPLLERVPDPDVVLAYLGARSAELRVCRVVALRLGVDDLRDHLVVIAPDRPLSQLSVALVAGLRADAERCLTEQRGVAVVVDPSTARPAEGP